MSDSDGLSMGMSVGAQRGRSGALPSLPELTSFDLFEEADEGVEFEITFEELLAAAEYTGGAPTSFRLGATNSGDVTVNGSPASEGETISAGDTFGWTSDAPAGGTTEAFTASALNAGGESSFAQVYVYTVPAVMQTMEVIADSRVGQFTDAGGTTPATSDGQEILSWTNLGTAGGLLTKGSFGLGPRRLTVNGVPVLNMTHNAGQPRVLGIDIASAGTGDITIYYVIKHLVSTMGAQEHRPWSLLGTSDGNSGFTLFMFEQTLAGHTLGVGGENMGLSGNPLPIVDESWHVGCARRASTGGSNGTWTVAYDGVQVDSANVTASTTVSRFNAGFGGSASGFEGYYVFAAVARTSSHSDAVRAAMSRYLEEEFADLVDNDKVVVAVGDSTSHFADCNVSNTVATFSPASYNWGRAARNLKAEGLSKLYVQAVNGAFLSTHSVTRIAELLNKGVSKKILAVMMLTNDLTNGGANPTQAFNSLMDFIDDIRALVPDVVVLVEPPTDGDPAVWGAGYPAERAELEGYLADSGNQATYDYTYGTMISDPVGLPWGHGSRDPLLFKLNDGLHAVGPGHVRQSDVFTTDLTSLLA